MYRYADSKGDEGLLKGANFEMIPIDEEKGEDDIKSIFLFIAYSISSVTFPTPENTIFFGLIPALIAFINSPPDTTSAPRLFFLISFNIPKFELAFTA